MQTLREYAEENGITYEAVRKQVAKYGEELKGHIVKEKGITYLQDKAIEILNFHRDTSKIQVVSARKVQEMQQQQDEIEQLLKDKIALQEKLEHARELIDQLRQEQIKGIETQAKYTLLIEQKELTDKKLEQLQTEKEETKIELATTRSNLENAQNEIATVKAELEQEKASYKKSIFGLYKKIN